MRSVDGSRYVLRVWCALNIVNVASLLRSDTHHPIPNHTAEESDKVLGQGKMGTNSQTPPGA